MTEGMKRSKAMAWLQLLRAPNLLTVPGDPVAGYLLAMHGGVPRMELLGAVLASLFFYCAGLLLNDVRDLDEDRRDRYIHAPRYCAAVQSTPLRGADSQRLSTLWLRLNLSPSHNFHQSARRTA